MENSIREDWSELYKIGRLSDNFMTVHDYIEHIILSEFDEIMLKMLRRKVIKYGKDKTVAMSHFGLGLWLRNSCGLWNLTETDVVFYAKQLYPGTNAIEPDGLSALFLLYIIENHLF